MFSVVLWEPEIPPNTGNIIRLCANTGCELHLIEPLGFSMNDKQLKRAGLDYHDYADVSTWKDWETFRAFKKGRVLSFSIKNTIRHSDFRYQSGDLLLFGSETRGLPDAIRHQIDPNCRLTIPMSGDTRSLNLSNCAAIVVYEAWRQAGFPNATTPGGSC